VTAPIAAIGAIAPISATTSVTPTAGTAAAGGATGIDFASALGKGLDAVSGAQANAENLAVQAATGQLTDPAQLTIATTQATLMTQLATTLQSKAVAAFNTIMGLQA
jgi:flagellar hook-basal body complex protein FliE